MPQKTKKRRLSVSEALVHLEQEEIQKLIDMDEIVRTAILLVEDSGIVFLDEIDKIAGENGGSGPDVSREGVQRDLLPIIEGTNVLTKYGMVRTDHVLFIASGAFHVSKPSDLIPELQGRFPIRVELHALTANDFQRILFLAFQNHKSQHVWSARPRQNSTLVENQHIQRHHQTLGLHGNGQERHDPNR